MFLSYKEINYLGIDSKAMLHSWEYKIIDSEFEEIGVGLGLGPFLVTGVPVIDTYEKRNLNVAANLIRSFIWYSKKYNYPISDVVNWNKQYNPKFAKYEEDVNKYLILI